MITINGTSYRIGRDSITASHIPIAGTDIAMGYVNGHWPSANDFGARFPNIPHVTIDVNGQRPDADVLDIENGDATPQGAVSWVRAKLARGGEKPVLYVNRGNITPVFNAMASAGYHIVSHFYTWLATLDGTQRIADMTGVLAVQYLGNVPANYDESIIWDQNWKKPIVTPNPPPQPVKAGILVELPGGATHQVSSTDGGTTWQS